MIVCFSFDDDRPRVVIRFPAFGDNGARHYRRLIDESRRNVSIRARAKADSRWSFWRVTPIGRQNEIRVVGTAR